MKKLYGVIELKDSEGKILKVFQVKTTTDVEYFPEEAASGVTSFFEDKKEAEKLYHEKLDTYIDQHI